MKLKIIGSGIKKQEGTSYVKFFCAFSFCYLFSPFIGLGEIFT